MFGKKTLLLTLLVGFLCCGLSMFSAYAIFSTMMEQEQNALVAEEQQQEGKADDLDTRLVFETENQKKQPSPLAPESPYEAQAAPKSQREGYLLVDKDGFLAVFTPDREKLLERTDIRTASLPTEERRRLKTGIFISDDKKLAAALQDYSS
ncbi:MAG: BofC C-terminal domain-containing protein [Clostridiales bacterium]|nr:BofC C-terminal domain-containing protein [Clostridiales bacterium]